MNIADLLAIAAGILLFWAGWLWVSHLYVRIVKEARQDVFGSRE